jgi:hypothetical protein
MSPRKQRVLILGLISLGVLIVGFFGWRALFAVREFRKHGGPPPPFAEPLIKRETDVELIRDWMTVPYIAKTYQVHPRKIFDALGLSSRANEEKSLLQLNDDFFPDQPGIVLELVKAAVQTSQANDPTSNDQVPDPPSPP